MSDIGDRLRAQAARDMADAERLQGTRESLAAEEATLRARADQALADAVAVDAAMATPAPPPAPVPSPPPAPRPPPGPVADYRAEARHLFQPVREDLGLVMRSRPVVTGARPDKDLFPIDPLGVRSVMLNIYVGGTTPSCKPHRQYYGAFACATEYIGPLGG